MEIRVIQRKWNLIFDRYEIFLNDVLQYKAKSKLFSTLSKISIKDLDNREICVVVKNRVFNNYLNFNLEWEYGTSKIQSSSFIEYTIRISQGKLSFYEQKENVIGVFLNESQIGIISKNVKKILGQDKYHVLYEKGIVDPLLLIGFVISYDMQYHSESSGIVSWDYGNMVLDPVIKVDPNWKPKE